MHFIKAIDYGFRKVIQVAINPGDPEAVHADGQPHTESAPVEGLVADAILAFKTEFGRAPKSWEWCQDCIYNWKHPTVDKNGSLVDQEFVWTGKDLKVGLNKWSNPAHDEQEIVSTRTKTWDELYQEIDAILGEHIIFGNAPRQAAPTLVSEVEPDFELVVTGEPYMEDGLAKLKYGVLQLGISKMSFIAMGEDQAGFNTDRDKKYSKAQKELLAIKSSKAEALAIVGS